MLLKNAFIALFSFSILHADTLKECKSYADIISGCVEKKHDLNGKLWVETPYKNGKKEGIEKWYHENGKLVKEVPYKNDEVNGIAITYYENGNLKLEASGLNDMLHGDMKYYTEDGKLLALLKAENDNIISGECFNGKVLTGREIEEIDKFNSIIGKSIAYLQEICLSNDSK